MPKARENMDGLLDEHHAYYHGTKAAFDLYPYYRDKMTENPKKWHNYLSPIDFKKA
ncbi:MAG: hypothetical protein GXY86_15440 [Firmicutes bacterium]|nr:hypothetical protein [Bacillota bacterium]